MPINEIEIPGSSLSLTVYQFMCDSIPGLAARIMDADQFSAIPEKDGFHDYDHNKDMIRGFYSMVVPFEVEHLIEGIVTKTLFKRVETCDFIITKDVLYTAGKQAPAKVLERVLASLTGYGTAPMELEFRQMSQFQDRLSLVKKVALTNPKDREIRKVKLSGRIEDYTEYNVIDPRNHGIESVSGLVDSPLGPITVTVTRKGGIRLNVRKGFILTTDCLEWLVKMIRDEKQPEKNSQS